MNQSQVFDAIRELLPKVTKEAIISWADFIADMNFGDPQGKLRMCRELYAEILLIQQNYGNELATSLFNMGERYPLNTFELSGAAEKMDSGKTEKDIYEEISSFGWHPPKEYTHQVQLIIQGLG